MQHSTFQLIQALVQQRSAIVLAENKRYLVEARLTPVYREIGASGIDEIAERLRDDPHGHLAARVVDAMTTNETSFFRDGAPFHCLRDEVLPRLLRDAPRPQRINIWSAGCSSGQEAYSVAMLLKDHFRNDVDRFHILASDVSGGILERARAGVYSELEVSRGLTAELINRHFDRIGPDWQVDREIRDRVTFRSINLIDDWPVLPSMDVILLRNVLVYFDNESKKKVLGGVGQTLRPGGILMLGGSETTYRVDDRFERIQAGGCSYFCMANANR